MRELFDSADEWAMVNSILTIEISMLIRSMGAAKDFSNEDIKFMSKQVLDGFMARQALCSFASVILFFKMCRARIAPCNPTWYGVNPIAILDTFDQFLAWQKEQVAQAETKNPNGHLSNAARGQSLAKCLQNAPDSVKMRHAEVMANLKRIEKEQKSKGKTRASMQVQVIRLTSYFIEKHRAENLHGAFELVKAAAEKSVKEFLSFHELTDADGNRLKELLDEMMPERGEQGRASVGYTDPQCKNMVVDMGGNGHYKINSNQ